MSHVSFEHLPESFTACTALLPVDSLLDTVKDAAQSNDLSELVAMLDRRYQEARRDVVLVLINFIRRHRNPLLTVDCMLYVCDSNLAATTQDEIAKRHRVKQPAVAQRLRLLRSQLGIKSVRQHRERR